MEFGGRFKSTVLILAVVAACDTGDGSPLDPPPATPTEPGDWTIPIGTGTNYRAIHMIGNTLPNTDSFRELPLQYFEYLRDLNVNWVGLAVTVYVDDTMDPTVERDYDNWDIPTFTDEVLSRVIQRFRRYGFRVFMQLGLGTQPGTQGAYYHRWQLGDEGAAKYDDQLDLDSWPWALEAPNHEEFVAQFFQSYAEVAAYFGALAEREGVELFSFGTETDALFRTRPGGAFASGYGDELRMVVQAVRDVYSGALTYNQHAFAAMDPEQFGGEGTTAFWQDLELDVVGLDGYFPLADQKPTEVMDRATLADRWRDLFANHFVPLKEANPERPIVFAEFGYVDLMASPFEPTANEYSNKVFTDRDGNGLDDGEETQANILAALYTVMDEQPDVVSGGFIWGMMMATDEVWSSYWALHRDHSVRQKLAEDIVRAQYAAWR